MAPLTPDTAFLVGFCLEATLYGLHLVFAAYGISLLTWRRRSSSINYVLLALSVALLAASTSHYIHIFYVVVQGFTKHVFDPETGVAGFFESEFPTQYPMSIQVQIINVLSDLTLLYRCFIVWGRDIRVAIVPFIIMVAYTATGAATIHLLLNINPFTATPEQFATITNLGTSSFVLALVFNVLVTALLAYRIYLHTRDLAGSFGPGHIAEYRRTLGIVVESGAVLALAQALNVLMWELQASRHDSIWELVGLPLAQVYCIVPSLIIVRVGLGVAADRETQAHSRERGARTAETSQLRFASTTDGTALTTTVGGTGSKTLLYDIEQANKSKGSGLGHAGSVRSTKED